MLGALQNLFSFKPLQIGVDLGSSSIKVTVLKPLSGGSMECIAIGYEELPHGCIADGILLEPAKTAQSLLKCLKSLDVNYKTSEIIIGLKGLNAIYKKLVIPYESQAELQEQIVLEGQQLVDSDLADWIIDWEQLSEPNKEGQVPIILVVAKREAVESYTQLLSMLEVKPSVIDCDIFAIQNAAEFSYNLKNQTILCLDVGKDTCKINLIQDRIPIIVRNFSLGGGYLTDTISRNINCSFQQAESLKITFSHSDQLSNQKEIYQCYETYANDFIEEIKKTLDFFSSSSGENAKIDKIDKIILSGAASGIKDLKIRLQRNINSEVILINPFFNIKLKNKIQEKIVNLNHIFSTSVGLALRNQRDKK